MHLSHISPPSLYGPAAAPTEVPCSLTMFGLFGGTAIKRNQQVNPKAYISPNKTTRVSRQKADNRSSISRSFLTASYSSVRWHTERGKCSSLSFRRFVGDEHQGLGVIPLEVERERHARRDKRKRAPVLFSPLPRCFIPRARARCLQQQESPPTSRWGRH